MEKRLNKKTEEYFRDFKGKICEDIKMKHPEIDPSILISIMEYPRLVFTKDDLSKRKRAKNSVATTNRCAARTADGQQCSRHKRDNSDFCGTHCKHAPNGIANEDDNKVKKVEVFTQDINGIIYYLDHNKNIYKMEDILQTKDNPAIIGTYCEENGKYSIEKMI